MKEADVCMRVYVRLCAKKMRFWSLTKPLKTETLRFFNHIFFFSSLTSDSSDSKVAGLSLLHLCQVTFGKSKTTSWEVNQLAA